MAGVLDDVKLRLVEDIEDLFEFKRWVGERRETPLAVDTETGGLNPFVHRLRLVQFGDLHTGWAIPWDLWKGGVLEIIKGYEGEWTCHNLPFEQKFFKVHGGVQLPWERCHDTLVQAKIDDPLRPAGLKWLADRMVDRTATQGQKALHDGMQAQGWTWDTVPMGFGPYWCYAALDTVLTAHLHEKLYRPVTDVAPRAYALEMAVLRICTAMSLKGMLLDVPYVHESKAKLQQFSQDARAWLKSTHGITSPMSGGQLSRAFEGLGCEITEYTDSGAPKMDKAVLEFFKKNASIPEARQLAEYTLAIRHTDKIIGSYLDNFLNLRDSDDLIHANIGTMAARTGRMSVTDPALQTLHRDDKIVRGSFVPHEGNVYLSCDLDQVEARFGAHYADDAGLIEAFRAADTGGADFFCGIASEVYNEEISKEDPRRTMIKSVVYGCVPLDVKIMTKRGWLAYNEVILGDETIGINPDTGLSEWTKITDLHLYDDAPVVSIGNDRISFTTTPNHRWFGDVRKFVNKKRVHEQGFFTTQEFTREHRAILSAPLSENSGLPMTSDEAALLGWLLSDGDLTVNYVVSGTAQSHGSKRAVQGYVQQSVKKYSQDIFELLDRIDVPHTLDVRDGVQNVWRISAPWLRGFLKRIGFFYEEWPDPMVFAASLNSDQAAAMLDSMQKADGKNFTKTKIWQLELAAALVYFSGQVPSTRWYDPSAQWSVKRCAKVFPTKPILTGQKMTVQEAGNAPVWCVTTELGTWTMRQPGENYRIVLTGNSLYGAGPVTMAETAKVPLEQMTRVKEAFDGRFPGLSRALEDTEREAKAAGRTPYIRSALGHRLTLEQGREYTQGLNARIQGNAAAYFKQTLVDMDACGLGDNLVLPVHDEALLEVPAGDAEEALKLVEQCMTNRTDYKVPITAGGKIMRDRWVK